MDISLVVEPTCRVAATPLVFAGRPGETMNAASQVEVSCNDQVAVAVRLDGGRNPEGRNRRMLGDNGFVDYAIFSDAAGSQTWEVGQVRSGTAGPVPLVLDTFGRIDPQATAAALGRYSDTVTVTVDF